VKVCYGNRRPGVAGADLDGKQGRVSKAAVTNLLGAGSLAARVSDGPEVGKFRFEIDLNAIKSD
jgi:hypothetical protein